MKRTSKLGVLTSFAVALIIGSAAASYAQSQGMMENGGGPGGPGMGGGRDGAGAGMLLRMKDKLALSDDQVSKLKGMIDTEKSTMKPLFEQRDADFKNLEDQLKAGAKDDALKPLLDKLEKDHQSIESTRKNYLDQVKAILTPTQQAKFIVGVGERMKRMGPRGEGHMGKNKGPDRDNDDK